MKPNDLLAAFDAAAANLSKLETVLDRAEPFMPKGPARGNYSEYDDLDRAWTDLLAGLPKVDGWTVTAGLPDLDSMGCGGTSS